MTQLVTLGEGDKPLIANLIQLYLYDMSAVMNFPVGADGRYEYDFLDRFWQHPYAIRVDGELAGFALVIEECPVTGLKPCWFMAEFFVLRGYRRQGVGCEAVDAAIALHPGQWHIAALTDNEPATLFWDRVLEARDPKRTVVMFDDAEWVVSAFAS
jgi:predicted acetyltransferase